MGREGGWAAKGGTTLVGPHQGTYAVAAQRGANMTPDPQRQQAPQDPPQREFKTVMVHVKDPGQAADLRWVARRELLEQIRAASSCYGPGRNG